MTRIVELIDVSMTFESRDVYTHAIQRANLSVDPGEFLTILGKSGSGKSSLLYIMGLLETPTSGSVLFLGEDVVGLRQSARARLRALKTGFVYQSFNLIGDLSAIENVMLPLKFGSGSAGKRAALSRCEEVLALVGLDGRMNHFPSQLSGGQQQRVAIARAIVAKPPIVFADEPTGNLDANTGGEIFELLRNLVSLGSAVVLVTHDETLAMQTDRVVRMVDGKLLQGGSRCAVSP